MKSKKIFILAVAVLFVVVPWDSESAFGMYIIAWGSNYFGESNPPKGLNFVKIAAGYRYGLGIRSNGSLVGWGHNNYGQCNVPDGNDFVAIAAGEDYSLALRSDGSLIAWGRDRYDLYNVPADKDFIDIAIGLNHSLALKSNGSLVAWGLNDFGQCDIPEDTKFAAVAANEHDSIGLRKDGSLVVWGANYFGLQDVPSGNDFVAVAAGMYHCLALRADGTVAAWGYNDYGQCDVPLECDVPPDKVFVAIAAGTNASFALRADGTLTAWGVDSPLPPGYEGHNDFFEIVAGEYVFVALLGPSDDCLVAPVQVNQPYMGPTMLATGTDISSCGDRDTNDVWFSFTADYNFDYTISLCGSSFDTTLAVFDGCGGTELACNDDAEPGVCPLELQSQVTIALEKGRTYFIRVAGFRYQTGAYTLTIIGPRCIGYSVMDFNKDCKVDFKDFAVFVESWLECNLDPQSVCRE